MKCPRVPMIIFLVYTLSWLILSSQTDYWRMPFRIYRDYLHFSKWSRSGSSPHHYTPTIMFDCWFNKVFLFCTWFNQTYTIKKKNLFFCLVSTYIFFIKQLGIIKMAFKWIWVSSGSIPAIGVFWCSLCC